MKYQKLDNNKISKQSLKCMEIMIILQIINELLLFIQKNSLAVIIQVVGKSKRQICVK